MAVNNIVEEEATPSSRSVAMVEAIDIDTVCGLEIINSTQYPLEMQSFKPIVGHTASGTTGIVVWKIGNLDICLVLMWSIPWSHSRFSNILAIGFKQELPSLSDDAIYKEMYYHDDDAWFKRQSYVPGRTECSPLEITCVKHGFKSRGVMGTGNKVKTKIELSRS